VKITLIVSGCVVLSLLSGCRDASRDAGTAPNDEQIVYQINLEESLRHPSSANLSNIADTIQYIELKTRRDMPIGMVDIIEISDEYIFIAFKGTAFQFTRQGDYLRSIGRRGKGPGEYRYAGRISKLRSKRRLLSGQ
jgi:hypothetical protein